MPKTPLQRARTFLLELAQAEHQIGPGAWFVVIGGMIVLSDDCQERLAEVIADAQNEIREGFLRPPKKGQPHFKE